MRFRLCRPDWRDNARFGAALTPLPGGALLVYRTAFNHPLGLEPGDSSTFYDKPIAVLIGPGAVSNGDWESLRMGYHPMVKTYGRPTNGAFTSSDFPELGADWFFTKATGSGYVVDNHRYLAHKGVRPEVEVWLEQDDIAEGRDTVVEAAMRWSMNPVGDRQELSSSQSETRARWS